MTDILERAIITIVKMYKIIISPLLPRCCRYYPSCSAYMIGAIEVNGALLGLIQGIGRILRCNPLFPGGVDFPKDLSRKVWKWSKERY